jgi:hypothetical protein
LPGADQQPAAQSEHKKTRSVSRNRFSLGPGGLESMTLGLGGGGLAASAAGGGTMRSRPSFEATAGASRELGKMPATTATGDDGKKQRPDRECIVM